MPLFKGGQSMHNASCMSPCMCHCRSPVPVHGTHEGAPLLFLNTRDTQSRKDVNTSYATELHTMHASPLKALGTVYQTRSQGY